MTNKVMKLSLIITGKTFSNKEEQKEQIKSVIHLNQADLVESGTRKTINISQIVSTVTKKDHLRKEEKKIINKFNNNKKQWKELEKIE